MSAKTLAYYPGCSLHSTAKEMDESFRETAASFGLELREVPDWQCCGNTAAHARNRLLATALPANELTKVEARMKLDTVAVPCAACFSRFMASVHELEDARRAKEVAEVIGRRYKGGVAVHNLIDVFYQDVGLEEIRARVIWPLEGVKVACYYGCLLTRPPKVTQADDPEYPMHMDEVVEAVGAAAVDWNYKTDCCGASLALCEQAVVVELTKKILTDAVACGADIVVSACPLCQANLDTRQGDIRAKDPGWREIPVLYLSQVVGLACGVPEEKLGFKRHLVDPRPILGRPAPVF